MTRCDASVSAVRAVCAVRCRCGVSFRAVRAVQCFVRRAVSAPRAVSAVRAVCAVRCFVTPCINMVIVTCNSYQHSKALKALMLVTSLGEEKTFAVPPN